MMIFSGGYAAGVYRIMFPRNSIKPQRKKRHQYDIASVSRKPHVGARVAPQHGSIPRMSKAISV